MNLFDAYLQAEVGDKLVDEVSGYSLIKSGYFSEDRDQVHPDSRQSKAWTPLHPYEELLRGVR